MHKTQQSSDKKKEVSKEELKLKKQYMRSTKNELLLKKYLERHARQS